MSDLIIAGMKEKMENDNGFEMTPGYISAIVDKVFN